jgi:hypothetical protein
MNLNAKLTNDIDRIVGKVGSTGDRASYYTNCGEDGDQTLSDFGDIPISFGFLDFGFYAVDSGNAVSWLLSRLNSVMLVNCLIDSGNAISWLLSRQRE